jgi:hypothetical protein
MKRTLMLLGLACMTLVLLTGCENAEDTTGTDGTNGEPQPDALALAQTLHPILANGSDTVAVRVTVVDSKGRGIADVGVSFQTTHGTITPYATTRGDGTAEVVLTSAASAADIVATISAETEVAKTGARLGAGSALIVSRAPLSDELIAQFLVRRASLPSGAPSKTAPAGTLRDEVTVLMRGLTLEVQADPATLPADGISESRIAATLIETTRRVSLEGQEIRFGTTAGSITGRALTDASGSAVASLVAPPGGTSCDVTAFYGPDLHAAVHVGFRSLALAVHAESPALIADGTSSTQVVARLEVEEDGTAVSGARIDFTTSLGLVTSPATTNELGEATATLIAPSDPGSAEVAARFGVALTASATVSFVPPPESAGLLLRAEPATLPADGAAESMVIATPLDGDGNPMPDGTPVTFSVVSGGGRIIGPVRVTHDGEAQAVYVAGTTAGIAQTAAVSGAAYAAVPILLTTLDVGRIVLTADAEILANSVDETRVVAVVTDRFGHPVQANTTVQFTTSLGVLEDASPTDVDGRASVRLRSEKFVTGTARVCAGVGSIQQTIDIKFVSQGAAHVEAIAVDHPRLGVLGAGDHETSTILFEVQDRNGIPVDPDRALTLTFSVRPLAGNTDATITPGTGTTNERGQVAATVNAGIISGAVEVRAVGGALESRPIRVAIHGGLPDPSHFGIFFERINIEGLCYAGVLNHVTAKVGDEHGNCVPESTAVWFESDYGIVQGSAPTNELCDAVVFEETGAPFPQIPGGDGLVRICAQTVGSAGNLIQTCGYVMWSGPTIVEITSPASGFNVPNGGSIALTYRVHDANENPLTGGTTIKVTTTAGQLGGAIDIELPDTQSSSYTTFQAVLSDADATVDRAQSVTVTVTVKGKNGPGTAFITGTMN